MSILPRKFDIADSLPTPPAPAPKPAAPAAPPPPPANNWTKSMPSDKPPKLVRLHLTDEAQVQEDEFRAHYEHLGCSCHISAPCGSCTHPGNPMNLAEDDDAWVMGHDPDEGRHG